MTNDFDKLATEIVCFVSTGQWHGKWVDQRLVARVSERLQHGPQITIWPKDAAEAAQRARDRARQANAPVIPRVVLKPPVIPTLPRVELPPMPLPRIGRVISENE